MIKKATGPINPARLDTTRQALREFMEKALRRNLEGIRLARSVCGMLIAGVSPEDTLMQNAIQRITDTQRSDGGWSDTDETAWAAGVVRHMGGTETLTFTRLIDWLNANRQHRGGWGRHSRDIARIPTTALVARFVPECLREVDHAWLTSTWQHDFDSPVRLSYKAGFYLLTASSDSEKLVHSTLAHLRKDQNEDGGFAPWRGHPIGSEVWSTGVVLWGAARWRSLADAEMIEKALGWLARTQLPDGLWPYHYLDDGATLGLIGATAALAAGDGVRVP